jgi:hypothetical protein
VFIVHFIFQYAVALELWVTGNRYCNTESARCYSGDKLMCNGNDTGHLVPTTPTKKICHANWLLWVKHTAPNKMHHSLIEVLGVMLWQHVRKWCTV